MKRTSSQMAHTVKIQPVVDKDVYDMMMYVRAADKVTATEVVNRAVRDYTLRYHPDLYELCQQQ